MNYSEDALQKVREDRLLIDEVDRWLYEEIAPYVGQRVIEIGCGQGNFAQYFVDRELYIGIETAPDSVAYVRERFGGQPNVEVYQGDATAAEITRFAARRLDTAFSLNVFEHIEDHESALRNVHEMLQPGGHFVLIVPAHRWLYGKIDEAIGHYRRYDKQMVRELFQRAGFVCLDQKYINLVGALGWYVSARVRQEETPPAGQLKLFNHLVPMLKRIERMVPPPAGISVLSVGRKPAG